MYALVSLLGCKIDGKKKANISCCSVERTDENNENYQDIQNSIHFCHTSTVLLKLVSCQGAGGMTEDISFSTAEVATEKRKIIIYKCITYSNKHQVYFHWQLSKKKEL